jgi:hypothetical protein
VDCFRGGHKICGAGDSERIFHIGLKFGFDRLAPNRQLLSLQFTEINLLSIYKVS